MNRAQRDEKSVVDDISDLWGELHERTLSERAFEGFGGCVPSGGGVGLVRIIELILWPGPYDHLGPRSQSAQMATLSGRIRALIPRRATSFIGDFVNFGSGLIFSDNF